MARIDEFPPAQSGTGVASGTSFPGSPATNDLFFRTDRALLYFYDGTRWLTTTLYEQQFGIAALFGANNATSDSNAGFIPSWGVLYDMWLVDFFAFHRVATTNNGSNYWSSALRKLDQTAASVTTIVTVNTSAATANHWVTQRAVINALLGTTWPVLDVVPTKTGAPGVLHFSYMLTYRLVG